MCSRYYIAVSICTLYMYSHLISFFIFVGRILLYDFKYLVSYSCRTILVLTAN